MTNILFLTSSPRGGVSHSNRVAARVLEELCRVHPHASVTVRDLAKDPVRHIDEDFVTGMFAAADRLNTAQREKLAQSDILIDELMAADIVVSISAFPRRSRPGSTMSPGRVARFNVARAARGGW